jgi:hypothetical protein
MRRMDKLKSIKNANILAENTYISLKENIDGKFSNKKSITNALYKMLQDEHVEGRYTDENWQGVRNLIGALNRYDIDYELVNSEYQRNRDSDTHLPNKKVYLFNIKVLDSNGQQHMFPLQVTCAFVGRTGTMEDGTYELTYYFMI